MNDTITLVQRGALEKNRWIGPWCASRYCQVKSHEDPATTSVTVLTTGQFETVTITDLLGRVVDQRQVTDSYTEVDVKGWSAGLYLVTLDGESGKLTEQLVVE